MSIEQHQPVSPKAEVQPKDTLRHEDHVESSQRGQVAPDNAVQQEDDLRRENHIESSPELPKSEELGRINGPLPREIIAAKLAARTQALSAANGQLVLETPDQPNCGFTSVTPEINLDIMMNLEPRELYSLASCSKALFGIVNSCWLHFRKASEGEGPSLFYRQYVENIGSVVSDRFIWSKYGNANKTDFESRSGWMIFLRGREAGPRNEANASEGSQLTQAMVAINDFEFRKTIKRLEFYGIITLTNDYLRQFTSGLENLELLTINKCPAFSWRLEDFEDYFSRTLDRTKNFTFDYRPYLVQGFSNAKARPFMMHRVILSYLFRWKTLRQPIDPDGEPCLGVTEQFHLGRDTNHFLLKSLLHYLITSAVTRTPKLVYSFLTSLPWEFDAPGDPDPDRWYKQPMHALLLTFVKQHWQLDLQDREDSNLANFSFCTSCDYLMSNACFSKGNITGARDDNVHCYACLHDDLVMANVQSVMKREQVSYEDVTAVTWENVSQPVLENSTHPTLIQEGEMDENGAVLDRKFNTVCPFVLMGERCLWNTADLNDAGCPLLQPTVSEIQLCIPDVVTNVV